LFLPAFFWRGLINIIWPFLLRALPFSGLAIRWMAALLTTATYRVNGMALHYLSMDWVSIGLMGFGFYVFLDDAFKILAIAFLAGYAWSVILALLRYKITNKYSIDTGLVGPTELRIGISVMLLLAMIYPFSLVVVGTGVIIGVYIVNFIEFYNVLKYGNEKDAEERAQK